MRNIRVRSGQFHNAVSSGNGIERRVVFVPRSGLDNYADANGTLITTASRTVGKLPLYPFCYVSVHSHNFVAQTLPSRVSIAICINHTCNDDIS